MVPGLTQIFFFCGKSSQNCCKPVLIFWSSRYTMYVLAVQVVSYYDLSVLSTSLVSDGFPKTK